MFRTPDLLYKCDLHQTSLLINAKTEHIHRHISGTVTPIVLHSLFSLCGEAPYISVIQLMNRAHLTPCLFSNAECAIENGSSAAESAAKMTVGSLKHKHMVDPPAQSGNCSASQSQAAH